MNDFTKYELEEIALDMYLYAQRLKTRNLKESPIHKELRDKVQNMIDNYDAAQEIPLSRNNLGSHVMEPGERERKFKIYREAILPRYGNDPDKVPPHLEPDFNEGWR